MDEASPAATAAALRALSLKGKKQPKGEKHNPLLHPLQPKMVQPPIRKFDDGSWGPTRLYGSRIKETKLMNIMRASVKPSRLKRIEEVLAARCKRVQCLFENLHDPANGAACLRTMEAFGLHEAHAVESYEPFKVAGGVTMNADKWMAVSRYRHCLDATTAVKERGYTLVATCLDEDSVPIDQVDFSKMEKICLMFGNEERGLSFALRDCADIKVSIPMAGFSQSFNISVSCAMTIYHMRQAGVIQPDLEDHEMTELYLRWLIMSTKRAAEILRRHDVEKLIQDF